jgi:hypothetical protein
MEVVMDRDATSINPVTDDVGSSGKASNFLSGGARFEFFPRLTENLSVYPQPVQINVKMLP